MTGNKTIDTVILALAFIATATATGVFVYTNKIYKKPLPSNEVELQRLKDDVKGISVPESYKLDKIIVNLVSKTRRLRFLDIEAHLVVFNGQDIAILEENKAIINDKIIDIASGMTPDELNSIAGKLIFENRVKKAINGSFGRPIIKELFYTKFVIQ
jgi:flagellar FliL protein